MRTAYQTGEQPQPGDVVECVSEPKYSHPATSPITNGESYVVRYVTADGCVYLGIDTSYGWWPGRFRLVSRAASKTEAVLNTSDKARRVLSEPDTIGRVNDDAWPMAQEVAEKFLGMAENAKRLLAVIKVLKVHPGITDVLWIPGDANVTVAEELADIASELGATQEAIDAVFKCE